MSVVSDQAHGVVTPAVSVVIPTRGRPALLREAIASVLAQTFADLEVIVVEDGGDDARAVVDGFGQRVRHVSQSHQGVAVARNTGVANSRAEWIAFLDDDDRWEPTKLDRQLEIVRRHPDTCFVHTDYVRLTADGTVEPRRPTGDLARSGPMLRSLAFSPPGFILLSSALVRRATFLEVGGFDPGVSFVEDYDLFMRMALAHPFAYAAEPLTLYRRHKGNITATPRMFPVRAARVAVLERFLQRHPRARGALGGGVRAHLSRAHLLCARLALRQGARYVRRHAVRAIAWNAFSAKPYVYLAASMTPGGVSVLGALVSRRKGTSAGLPEEDA